MKSKKRKQRTLEKFQVRSAEVLAVESPQTIRPMNAANNHNLFFAPNNSPKDFGTVLREVQEYISSKYSTLILDGGKDEVKTQVKRYISKYLMDCRIAVLKTPLVDEDVGVAASIRIVNPQNMEKADFVNGGTATDEMLGFLAECLRYGISVCVAGATSSGKTTVAGWLLTTIPDNKRIFTIENGSRELALVRKKDGKVVNSVIHTLTRSSDNEKQNIDQDMLLDMALRFNPEVICVGEMRSAEAYTAQEYARTSHTVLTTIHSNSCEATWRRMATLCKRKYDIADDTLMSLVTEAFPIVVFTKQLENKQRKIMEIMECEILPDGTRNFRTLYRFHITESRMEGDRFIISGSHMLAASEIPRIAGQFGLDTSTRGNLMSTMYAAQTAMNITRTVVRAVAK